MQQTSNQTHVAYLYHPQTTALFLECYSSTDHVSSPTTVEIVAEPLDQTGPPHLYSPARHIDLGILVYLYLLDYHFAFHEYDVILYGLIEELPLCGPQVLCMTDGSDSDAVIRVNGLASVVVPSKAIGRHKPEAVIEVSLEPLPDEREQQTSFELAMRQKLLL
jgi:hypothetical protein